MIRALKDFAKRHWPALRLRTILFLTLLFVAALPGIGAVFLRVYENTLVQQTEAELIAQAAALSGAYRVAWGADDAPAGLDPQRPRLDLSEMPILPAQPEASKPASPPDPRAAAAATALRPIVIDTGRTTLAAIRILDPNGTVLLGHGDTGLSYAALPEIRAAARGETRTVLRERADYRPTYNLEWLSRAAGIRVEYVRPIFADGRVIGILMLSRSPRGLFLGIYQDRGKILLGIVLIFLTLLVLAGLLSRGIARPIEALSAATENVARGPVSVPEPPPTAAIEIRALYLSFAAMAERIERRSRYLRDFAAAVSHELKTPISGIKGAIELLEEHPEMAEAERRRFLANAAADADRLSHLLRRLLDLARADMAVTPEGAETDVEGPALTVVDAQRGKDFEVAAEVADLPPVAAPAEMLTAVLETLVENSRQAGARRVRIAGRGQEDRVLLTVSDDGPGIPESDRERIFDPFHTTRRKEGGSGLGLSIARSLLSACGGTIQALPTETGARFEIILPGTGRGRHGVRWRGGRDLHQPPSTSLRLVPLPVPGRSSYSNSKITASTARLSPGLASTFFTTPAFSARRMFSIFIASTTASGWPASTLSPSPTWRAVSRPGIGQSRYLRQIRRHLLDHVPAELGDMGGSTCTRWPAPRVVRRQRRPWRAICTVRARPSMLPLNRRWPGSQRPISSPPLAPSTVTRWPPSTGSSSTRCSCPSIRTTRSSGGGTGSPSWPLIAEARISHRLAGKCRHHRKIPHERIVRRRAGEALGIFLGDEAGGELARRGSADAASAPRGNRHCGRCRRSRSGRARRSAGRSPPRASAPR